MTAENTTDKIDYANVLIDIYLQQYREKGGIVLWHMTFDLLSSFLLSPSSFLSLLLSLLPLCLLLWEAFETGPHLNLFICLFV